MLKYFGKCIPLSYVTLVLLLNFKTYINSNKFFITYLDNTGHRNELDQIKTNKCWYKELQHSMMYICILCIYIYFRYSVPQSSYKF